MSSPPALFWIIVALYFIFRIQACVQITEQNTCHRIIGDDTTAVAGGACSVVKCEDAASTVANVTDRMRGRVTFLLPSLPHSCNVTRYEIALRVRDSAGSCSTPDAQWQTHSRRNIHIVYCSKHNATCISQSPPCPQNMEVKFAYVYSGWYQLKVTPHLGPSTRQAQRSRPIQLFTEHQPKRFVKNNRTVSTVFQYRDERNESTASFEFSRDVDWGGVDQSHVTLRLMSRVDNHVADFCYGSGEEHSCCAFNPENAARNDTGIACSPMRGANCSASQHTVECVFRNITPGAYCAVLAFIDDRCEPDTLWTEPNSHPCQWHVYKEFTSDSVRSAGSSLDSSADSASGIALAVLAGCAAVALVVAALVFLHCHRLKRHATPTRTAEGPQHRYVQEQRHFNFSNQFTLSERPRPEVLLVYCRDSKPFVELVVALRNVLNKICKCQVYDYFDDALWDHVSEDPEGWVRELVLEREAKVVIVASRGAALAQRPDGGIRYRNPHALDHIFPFLLKLVRDHANEESYRRHFVVTFDGYTESTNVIEHLNPYTRFVLPKHLNRLFEHLHDSSATVHFDTSRKLEEREEVRQLRLRLEHLINLSLLHVSSAASTSADEQIYDW